MRERDGTPEKQAPVLGRPWFLPRDLERERKAKAIEAYRRADECFDAIQDLIITYCIDECVETPVFCRKDCTLHKVELIATRSLKGVRQPEPRNLPENVTLLRAHNREDAPPYASS